jgi:hypothetical protein
MSDFERKKQELEFKSFATKNFVKPSECKNLEQVRFYLQELISRMEHMRSTGFIPEHAYALLAQYNAAQNRLLTVDFKNNYC